MTHEERTPEFWEAVKADYLGGTLLADLYKRYGLTKGAFDHFRDRARLPLRNKAPVNRDRLAGRLYWLINHHVATLELAAEQGQPIDPRLLAQLADALGKLLRFETGSASAGAGKERTRDIRDVREKLVRRIEELKRN